MNVIKMFSTSLLIYCGPLAYNFLHRNLSDSLPSLRTVQRTLHKDYRMFVEGDFRCDDLLVHLNSFNAKKLVSIGEDATRVIVRVEYHCESK